MLLRLLPFLVSAADRLNDTVCATCMRHVHRSHSSCRDTRVQHAGCYLQSSVDKIKQTHSSLVIPVRVDVTNDESVEQAAAFIADNLPADKGLDGLVNNAGLLVTPG